MNARINAALDGSTAGDAIVASGVSTAGGCDRLFLDIYAYSVPAARFVDVFDGSTGGSAGSGTRPGEAPRLLPQPVKT
ncbi:MAG: hypothetical protein ACYDCQ_22775, partial [Dehalococcoidia bacterium]